jgi:hypothetical protein
MEAKITIELDEATLTELSEAILRLVNIDKEKPPFVIGDQTEWWKPGHYSYPYYPYWQT